MRMGLGGVCGIGRMPQNIWTQRFMSEIRKDTEISTTAMLKRIFLEHGRQHVPKYLLAGVFLAIGAAATAYSAYLLKPVVNGMIDGEGFKYLRTLAWAVTGLFIVRGLATYISSVILAHTGNRIVANVQNRLYQHIVRQGMSFFNASHSTEFMTRLAYAANGVRDALQVLVLSLCRDVLTVVGLIVIMFVHDPVLAAISLVVMPIAAFLLGGMVRNIRKFARRGYSSSAEVMQIVQETIQGGRIVKSFNLENYLSDRMSSAVRNVEKATNRVAVSAALSGPVSDALAGFAIGAVIFYGSWRVTVAQADAGSFFSFMAALLLAYEPAKRIARLKLDIQNGLTGAQLIYDIIDRPLAEVSNPNLPLLQLSLGRIEMIDVTFRYREGDDVLNGVNLLAAPNKTTALVGPSGGGKSTVISLIQRFYEVSSGRILIDGQDIAGVQLHSLRDQIAFVSQDVFLFRGTIRENIALGRQGASEEEIIAAAKKAYAHEFIMGFATGYDTQVGEHGAQLSGGQKQRIAIARAVLKNAPILLLDEPTAALDHESERMVQEALDSLRAGRTTIVVAHRLQTIVNADAIYVLDEGKVAQVGVHSELIAQPGTYRTFFSSQFGEGVEPIRPAVVRS
jgi:subfamily B ATP-binding cassette protein MsbA